MARIALLALLLAAAGATGYTQETPAKPASPLAVTVTVDKAKVQLGEDIQLEIRVENTGDKDVELNELVYEERSVSFQVNAEFKGDGNPKKTYTLSRIVPDALVMPRLPLARVSLGSKKSVNLLHRTPAIAVGKFEYVAKYAGADAEVSAKGVTVEVEATTAGSRLAAVVEVAEMGTFSILLKAEQSPGNVTNFATLIKRGFYNDSQIHRIVKSSWIHMGCPYGLGIGGPGHAVKAELDKEVKHVKGTVSMSGYEKSGNYTGSQFFICLSNLPSYEGKFTAIGNVEAADMDKVVDPIGKKPVDRNTESPTPAIRIKSVTLQVK